MYGVYNVLKPAGMTSHDVVAILRRNLGLKKVGHAGTLDPNAVGVLPVCVGRATRLLEFLIELDKEYLCELTFGVTTETQDASGRVVCCKSGDQLTLEKITSVLPQFIGEIRQTVPAYSAVKVQGVPLYKRAHLGLTTELPSRSVFVSQIKIVKFRAPRLVFTISCSKGTYVRTICHDWGKILGVGGHLSFLLRTRVGHFSLSESRTLEEIMIQRERFLLPPEVCVQDLPQIILSGEDLKRVRLGQKIILAESVSVSSPVAVFNIQGQLEAIAEVISGNQGKILKPRKVLKRE